MGLKKWNMNKKTITIYNNEYQLYNLYYFIVYLNLFPLFNIF